MSEKLINYFKGYLILELYGDSKERLINLCKNREIELFQLCMIKEQWFCKIKYRDYLKIKELIIKTGCVCNVKEKKGFIFLLQQIKERKGLIFGGILFFLILFQCSGRIWSIRVEGGFLHTKEQLLQMMEEDFGIYGGISATQVDCFEIEKRIRLAYNEIGWISVEKKGCRLHVMLNESTMPKKQWQKKCATHIIASQDGIVRKVEVMSGVPVVKAGDIVKKGEVLISGVLTLEGDYDEIIRKEPAGADGKVYLESEFTYEAEYAMLYEQKKYIKKRTGLEIFLFEKKIFSYIPRYSEGKYDIMSIDIVPFCFEDYHAPFLLKKHRLLAYNSALTEVSEKEIIRKADAEWNSFLSDWQNQGVEIIRADYSLNSGRKKAVVTGTITACGNFISYQEILEEEWKNQDEYSGNNP